MVGAREAGEGAITVVDGLVEGDDDVATEDDLDTDLVLFLGEDILLASMLNQLTSHVSMIEMYW